MPNISTHFTQEELVHTDQPIPNPIDAASLANLQRLCTIALEPMRVLVGLMHINSGFRCDALNARVGGVSNSAHRFGRAADISCQYTPQDTFSLVKASDIQFDQLIWEPGWVHIGISEDGTTPRRQCLKATRQANGKMAYVAA